MYEFNILQSFLYTVLFLLALSTKCETDTSPNWAVYTLCRSVHKIKLYLQQDQIMWSTRDCASTQASFADIIVLGNYH